MATAPHKRTQTIIWLRRGLLLAALFILGGFIFLLIRLDSPPAISIEAIQQQDDGITIINATFDGKSANNRKYHIAVRQAHRTNHNSTQTTLIDLTARLDDATNPLALSAQTGIFDHQNNLLILKGNVQLADQQGRQGYFQSLEVNLATRIATTQEKLTIQTPQARIWAQSMQFEETAQLYHFTDMRLTLKQKPTQATTPATEAWAAQATYDIVAEEIIMQGDVRLNQHTETGRGQKFTGQKLIIDMKTGQYFLSGDNKQDKKTRSRIKLTP